MLARVIGAVLLCLSGHVILAQVIISGRVVTDEDKPLAKANVYVNGSTAGTIAADDGSFSLSVANPGFVDIIVSYVGYQTATYHTELSDKSVKVLFKLSPKPEVMRDVLILTTTVRTEWLRIFREHFLGITPAAEKTVIENEDAIVFTPGDKSNSIKAFSDDELVVVNKFLGYKIYFQLVEFYYDRKGSRTYYVGYSRFAELKENGTVPARYLKHRKEVYYGSTAHFYNSLIAKTTEAEGFLLRNIMPMPADTGKPQGTVQVIVKGAAGPVITPPQRMSLSLPISADTIIKQTKTVSGAGAYSLQWQGKLQVLYKKDPVFKYALSKRTFLRDMPAHGVISYLELLETPALMDKTGSLNNPLVIQTSGYWSYDLFANMLPVDYKPG